MASRDSSLDAEPRDDDKLHEECGVFGVWNVAGRRGRDRARPARAAASRAGGDRHRLLRRRTASTATAASAWSATISATRKVIASLPGAHAVGHNRYATTGETILRNVQPLYADFEFGGFAVAHNGNLTNAHALHSAAGPPRLPVPVAPRTARCSST